MEKLIGKKIKKIFINDESLKFETDQGDVCYSTYGDCCSITYFHDFIGVENLLKNGPVKSVEDVPMDEVEGTDQPENCCEKCKEADCLSYYGYKIVTESPEFGEMTSVLSFRNDSNGYYGGSIGEIDSIPEDLPEIKTDWIND